MGFFTADMCDEHKDNLQVAEDVFKNYGKKKKFRGKIVTIKLDEDNTDLIKLLKEDGKGKVAVVDVGGAFFAVVGENLMKLAYENGWEGIVINGYVRDTHITKDIDVGLLALGTCPKKSQKKQSGKRGVELEFAGVRFRDGDEIFVDLDGVVIK